MHQIRGIGSGQKIEVLKQQLFRTGGIPPTFGIELSPGP